MYILIKITTNGIEHNILVANTKKIIVTYLRKRGYYYSKRHGIYINDRTVGISGGNGSDYKIEEIKQIN